MASTLGRRRRASRARSRRTRPRAVLPAALSAPERAPLIGLTEEMAHLRATWELVAAGSVQLALVGGEPGSGKTRLTREVARMAGADGAHVLVGSCHPHPERPYQPLGDALATSAAELDAGWLADHTTRFGPSLTRLVPSLGSVADTAGREAPGASPVRFHRALADALDGMGGGAPVLLVLEDLHWATPSTVRAVRHLAQAGAGSSSRMVLVTYRDREVHPSHPLNDLIDGAEPGARLNRLVLGGLTAREVSSLVVDRLSLAGTAAGRLAEVLWQVTDGNPLFLVEVLRDLVYQGVVAGGVIQGDALAGARLPLDLDELVRGRLARLDDLGREAVEAASVVAPGFTPQVLAHTVAASTGALQAALERAEGMGLVRGPNLTGAWRFTHASTREAVYRSLSPSRRVRLHERIGETMEAGGEVVPPAVLAHHFVAAAPVGGSEKALRHAVRAAEEAALHLAFEEAADHYSHALSMLGVSGAPPLRVDLLLDLGEAYRRADDPGRARQSFLQGAFCARASGDGPRLARATLALGRLRGTWGPDDELIGLLDLALVSTRDDAGLQARLLARLAEARATRDDAAACKARCDRAWELAWESRDPAIMSAVLAARALALSTPDDLDDRIEATGELLAIAGNAWQADLAAQAHGWRFVDLVEKGRIADAERDRAAHAKLARQSGDPGAERDAAAWAAAAALLVGDRGQAATQIDLAHQLGRDMGDPLAPDLYWTQVWGMLVDWGEDSELDDLVPVWRDLVRTHEGEPAWSARFAFLLARVGRTAEAAAIVEDLVDDGCQAVRFDRSWLATMAVLAETAALVGAAPEAEVVADLLRPYSARVAVFEGGRLVWGSVARARGLALRAAGQPAKADEQLAAACSAHERMGAAPLLARSRWERGAALVAGTSTGDRLKGHHLLEVAASDADALGMGALAAWARAALIPAS